MSSTARVFSASLKPAWDEIDIISFLREYENTAKVWIINHDKDVNENGEIKEAHTHILMEYTTPRKISTIAKALKVDENFIEIVRNKKGMLRYLIHMDDELKHQYSVDDVLTNDKISYADSIMGQGLSDREIAEYIKDGRGMELLGVVSSQKLRAIQSFLHYDKTDTIHKELKALRTEIQHIRGVIDNVGAIANNFVSGIGHSVEQLTQGMNTIAQQIKLARIKK